jgi:hypothetical protein
MNTPNLNLSAFETSLLDAEKTGVIGDDDWNDGNSGLDCKMERSLFEWEHDWTVGVRPRAFREDPDADLIGKYCIR